MDKKNVLSCVVSKVKSVLPVALFAVVAFVLSSIPALAQTAEEIPITVPNWDFASLTSDILDAVMSMLKYALGIGVSIFLVSLLWRGLKRFAKG